MKISADAPLLFLANIQEHFFQELAICDVAPEENGPFTPLFIKKEMTIKMTSPLLIIHGPHKVRGATIKGLCDFLRQLWVGFKKIVTGGFQPRAQIISRKASKLLDGTI